MANFKRKKKKDSRAGCLLCKTHKANGDRGSYKMMRIKHRASLISVKEQEREA